MSTTLALRHPYTDPDFHHEKPAARAEVLKWWEIFCELLVAKPRTAAMQRVARKHGKPFGTVKRWFYSWQDAGYDWRVLVNRARFPEPSRATFPPAFEQWFVNLYESNARDRSGARAYQAVLARLSAWERDPFNPDLALPGYDMPPRRDPFTHVPPGWSDRSFYRLLERKSNVYQRTVRRQGPKAASVYLPHVHTSRVGLAFGQIFYHDDSQHDVYVNLTGRNSKAMRPLSLNSLEALSGSLCQLSLKPQLENIDGNGREELSQLDFFWHMMAHLTGIGYNAKDGTLHVFEWRTTNIDKDAHFDEAIARLTGGNVHIDRSGKFGKPEFKAMLFEGQSTGNFRFKAPIESFFQNVRNHSGWLPAPTGPNPDRAPEENYGLLLRNAAIQRLIDKIDQPTFLRLRRPVLEWEDYARLCRAIHAAIDQRRDHHLQGWEKLGFTRQYYRLSLEHDHWISESEYQLIPADVRAAYDHIVCRDGHFRTERLSPAEVFAAHRHQLTRLPMSAIPLLAPPRAWQQVTVSRSLEIEISDLQIDSEPLVYIARLKPSKGSGTITLERGKAYKVLLNPFDPSRLFVADKDGAYMGTAERLHVPTKLDFEGIVAQLGAINTIRADESVEVHARMRSAAAQRVEDYHFNKNLRAGRPATIEERATARRELRRIAQGEGDISELTDALISTTPPPPDAGDEHDDMDDIL